MNKKAWNIIKPILKLVFTVLALWVAYRSIDFSALQKIWREANGWYFIPAVITFFCCQVVTSIRLLQFLRNIGLPISMRSNFRLFLLGLFYNLFLPGGIGGDGYKIVALKQRYAFTTHKAVFSAVFFDRLSGLWAMALLVAIFSFSLNAVRVYSGWVIAVFILGTGIYYFVLRNYFRKLSGPFFKTHLLAIAAQLLQLITVAFILTALGCTTSYWPYFAIFILSSVASLFPFSIGGLGAREVAIVWGANTFGLNPDLAVSITLSYYVITLGLALTAILILFRKERGLKAEGVQDAMSKF